MCPTDGEQNGIGTNARSGDVNARMVCGGRRRVGGELRRGRDERGRVLQPLGELAAFDSKNGIFLSSKSRTMSKNDSDKKARITGF
jgi:hypothetical protein